MQAECLANAQKRENKIGLVAPKPGFRFTKKQAPAGRVGESESLIRVYSFRQDREHEGLFGFRQGRSSVVFEVLVANENIQLKRE
jgi:hypothetical protein